MWNFFLPLRLLAKFLVNGWGMCYTPCMHCICNRPLHLWTVLSSNLFFIATFLDNYWDMGWRDQLVFATGVNFPFESRASCYSNEAVLVCRFNTSEAWNGICLAFVSFCGQRARCPAATWKFTLPCHGPQLSPGQLQPQSHQIQSRHECTRKAICEQQAMPIRGANTSWIQLVLSLVPFECSRQCQWEISTWTECSWFLHWYPFMHSRQCQWKLSATNCKYNGSLQWKLFKSNRQPAGKFEHMLHLNGRPSGSI